MLMVRLFFFCCTQNLLLHLEVLWPWPGVRQTRPKSAGVRRMTSADRLSRATSSRSAKARAATGGAWPPWDRRRCHTRCAISVRAPSMWCASWLRTTREKEARSLPTTSPCRSPEVGIQRVARIFCDMMLWYSICSKTHPIKTSK